MAQSRPSRIIQPTAKLGADNVGNLQLKSHQQAIEKARLQPLPKLPVPVPLPSQSDNVATSALSTIQVLDPQLVDLNSEPHLAMPNVKANKRRIVESEGSNSDANATPNEKSPHHQNAKKKTKRASQVQGKYVN